LRRNALGLARTLHGGCIELPLDVVLTAAATGGGDGQLVKKTGRADVAVAREFIFDRLRGSYAERGISQQQSEAVPARVVAAVDSAPGPAVTDAGGGGLSLPDFELRLHAIVDFAGRPEAEALAAANKRSRNILRKADATVPATVDATLL